MDKLNNDLIAGSALLTTGGSMATIQYLTAYGNLALLFINIILALGGGILLFLNVKEKLRKSKENVSSKD